MATATKGRAKTKSAKTKSERIEARATVDEAAIIGRAADLTNSTVSSFVVGAAVAKAETVLARVERTLMPAAQFDAMIAALDDATAVPEIVGLASRPRRVARR